MKSTKKDRDQLVIKLRGESVMLFLMMCY